MHSGSLLRSVSTGRQCGVLVVDDEPDIRDVLQCALPRKGFAVWVAADGEEALDVYRGCFETIDVALLDVLMPRLDGPATLTALRQLRPELPCCFMTGYLGDYTAEDLRRKGARALLTKPFCLPEVVQVLRTLSGNGDGPPHGTIPNVTLWAQQATTPS
jgi:CheY-like chemotaxis protein